MLKELRALLVSGQSSEAAPLAEQLLSEQPNNVDVLHLAAITFARRGDPERAATLFERALMIAPEDPSLHLNLAQLHLAKGDLSRAKEGYKAASMLDPNLSVAHSSLGNLAAIGGDLAGAEELYLTALRADPNALPALLGRGHLLLDRGDVKTAMTVAQKAAKVAPEDARAQALYGRALLNAGHTAFAVQAFENAIQLKPAFFAARVMLARVQIARGEFGAAEQQLNAAADRAPLDSTLKFVRAELFAKTGRAKLAAKDLDDLLSISANRNISAIRARVALHFNQGEIEAGLQLLNATCVAHPREWLLNHAYIGYLLEFGQPAAARAAAVAWTERAPDFAPPWMHLASIDEGQGDYDSARDFAEKAFNLDQDLPQVVLILARARLRYGRPGEVQSLLSAMLAKPCSVEQRAEALALRGRALDALGQRNEAVSSWQEAAALKPSPLTLPSLSIRNSEGIAPEIATLTPQAANMPALIFLTGLPMSGVESVAWWLAHTPQAMVFNDRFSRKVELERIDFLNNVPDDRLALPFHASDLEHVRSRYLKALRRISPNAPLRLVVDWLPVLDLRQYRVLREALPEARWLHVDRDCKDALLGALMSGSQMLPLNTMVEAAQRMKEHHAHLTAVAKEHRASDFVFDFEHSKTEHVRLAKWLTSIEGVTAAPPEERWAKSILGIGGLPAYFSAKRWQAFEAPLAAAFKVL